MSPRLLPALLLLCSLDALAARPFVTDDARLTNAESCQLESWMRSYRQSQEVWALPACNPGGNLEFTVGGGRAKNDGEKSTSDYVLQAKTLFRPLTENDWGWGLGIGTVRHPENNPGPNLLGNIYAYVPVSASFFNDALVAHVNVGGLRDRATGTHSMTWGVGGEFRISSKFLAIAESFGDNHHQPYWQVGGRLAIIPDRVQIDATVGQPFAGSGNGRWISFGLRLTPERFF